MHSTSELYKQLLQNPLHQVGVKLEIAGQTYGHADIVSAQISGGTYTAPTIGVCASRMLEIEIFPKGEIPRQAQISACIRLELGEQASEWIPKGVFFISTRKLNKITGALTITAYDAMLKANQVWLNSSYDYENWPMPVWDAVNNIAGRMGVQVDARTQLNTAYPVEYPVDENGDMQMRDVLSMIAVANASNWVISDEGKLWLIKYGDAEPETSYLITESGEAILMGEVRLLV